MPLPLLLTRTRTVGRRSDLGATAKNMNTVVAMLFFLHRHS